MTNNWDSLTTQADRGFKVEYCSGHIQKSSPEILTFIQSPASLEKVEKTTLLTNVCEPCNPGDPSIEIRCVRSSDHSLIAKESKQYVTIL